MYWVLFDIDGTLLNSSGAGGRAMYAAVNRLYGTDLKLGSVAFHGRTDRGIITDILRLADQECDEAAFARVKRAYLEILPDELATVESRVFDGVHELLDELSGREQVNVGLLTGNMADGAEVKLGHFRIADYFSYGAFGDDHLSRNDVAAHALAGISEQSNFTVEPKNVWIVGDTPADIECGRHIDARVLAVSTGGATYDELRTHEADILVESLRDVDEFLKRLEE